MNENYTLEELEAYLYGELPQEKAKLLEEEIKTDLALRSELEALKISKEAIELAAWKKVISQSQRDFLANRPQGKQTQSISQGSSGVLVWTFRFAASVALISLAMGVYSLFSVSPESIISQPVAFSIPLMRSSEVTTSAIRSAYLDKDFAKVIEVVRSLANPSLEESFLLGMAYLETNAHEKAISQFMRVESENEKLQTKDFADEVDYFLVKAYLSLGQIEEGAYRMKKIRNDPQHTYHQNFGMLDQLKIFILGIKN